MAKVPYNPVPSARPEMIPTPTFRLNTPVEAFGGAVAQAWQGLGRNLEGAGDKIFDRAVAFKELENEAWAKEQFVNTSERIGKLEADYYSTEGKNAVDGYQTYVDRIKETRRQAVESAPNQGAARSLDNQLARRTTFSIVDGARHAANQNKAYLNGTSQAKVRVLQQKPGNPADPDQWEETARGIRQETHTQAVIRGWSPAQETAEFNDNLSEAWVTRIKEMSMSDPEGASSLYQANKSEINEKSRVSIESYLHHQLVEQGTRDLSNQIIAGGVEGVPPLSKESDTGWLINAIGRARELAKERHPDDPGYEDRLVDRLQTKYNQSKHLEQRQSHDDWMTLYGSIFGNGNPDQQIKDMDQIFRNPQLNDIYQRLPGPQQKSLTDLVRRMAVSDVPLTPERNAKWQELVGMAKLQPDEFMSRMLAGEANDLPRDKQNQLRQLGVGIQKGMADVHLKASLQTVQPLLNSYDIGQSVSDKVKNEEYMRFSGAFSAQLEEFQNTNKRRPTADEQKLLAAGLLRELASNRAWYNPMRWIEKTPQAYEVPSDAQKVIIDMFKADPRYRGRAPTVEEVTNIWQKHQVHPDAELQKRLDAIR